MKYQIATNRVMKNYENDARCIVWENRLNINKIYFKIWKKYNGKIVQ